MSAAQVKSNPNAENGNGVYHSLNMDVPDHWKAVPLEEVLDNIIGGGTPSKANLAYWVGSIPWLTVKDMRSRRPQDAIDHISKEAVRDSATNIIPADTVIIATRIGLGKVIRVPYEAAINQDLKALIAKPELEKGYLEYWILSIAEYLESIGSGTTVKGIRLEQLRSLPFPLAPLKEQKRIVAEIEKQFSRLDEAVANLRRVKANLKRYKAAVLKAAVEGKLTEEWRKHHPNVEPAGKLLDRIISECRTKWTGRGKYKEPTAPDTNNLSSLPRNWAWATVHQLAAPEPNSITDGPFGSNLKTEHYRETGPRVIRLQNIGEGVFVNEEAHISEQHFARLQKHRIFADDLVIAALGEDPPRTCLIPQSVGHAIVKADCIRFKPHRDAVARYLNVVLNSEPTRQRAKSIVHGVGRPRLNLGEIKTIVVPVPPTVEQQAIVAEVERRLSVIDELEATVEANLTRADRLRQSILQRAFSGKLVSFERSGHIHDQQELHIAAESPAIYRTNQ